MSTDVQANVTTLTTEALPQVAVTDVLAHIGEVAEVYLREQYPQYDTIKITNVRTSSDTQFSSQINYKIDQLVPNTHFDTIDQLEQTNNTSLVQEMQINRSEEVTNSYSWSATHGFSVGISVSSSFKVPFIGGIDTEISTSYSFDTTESQTEERKRTWSFTQKVNVAPQTKVKAIIMLEKTTPRVPFDLSCAITGEFYVHAEGYKNGVKQITISLYPTLAWVVFKRPLAGFSYSGNTAYFRTSGVFTANEGINGIIDITESPLNDPSRVSKRQTINVTPGMDPRSEIQEEG